MAEQLQLWGDESVGGLRWSVTRHRRLVDCPRKYYLFHYGSRGAQKPGAPRRMRELFVLKSLQNRYMWVGSVVHELVERALGAWQRGEEAPEAALVERGTRVMRAGYAQSLQRIYRDKPMQVLGLVEHEYDEPIAREEWRARRDHMEYCLHNFFGLPLARQIRQVPLWRWLALETLGSFDLDGATIVVKPDFAWRDDLERVVLVDWKTGIPRPEAEDFQLSVYGLFARRRWGLRAELFRALVAYLGTGEVREVLLGVDDLERAAGVIRDSVAQMRALDGQPKEAFVMTTELDQCARCNFRRVCGRE